MSPEKFPRTNGCLLNEKVAAVVVRVTPVSSIQGIPPWFINRNIVLAILF